MALFYPHYPTLSPIIPCFEHRSLYPLRNVGDVGDVGVVSFAKPGPVVFKGSVGLQSDAPKRWLLYLMGVLYLYIYIYNIIIYIYICICTRYIYIYNVYILTAKLCPCFFVGFCFGNHLTLPREWVRWVKGINGHDPMVSNVCFHSMCGPVDDGKHHGASARCGLFLPMLQLLALKVEKTCPHWLMMVTVFSFCKPLYPLVN